ncbi:TPA: hypothetical protein RKW99_004324 [Enterobacter asburiae]|nr:hypothetical protein [Enterobacter asburiae]
MIQKQKKLDEMKRETEMSEQNKPKGNNAVPPAPPPKPPKPPITRLVQGSFNDDHSQRKSKNDKK